MYIQCVCKIHRTQSTAQKQASFRSEKSFFEQSKLDFGLFGMSFLKNRQKSLSLALKSFICVVWSSKCYQTLPWTSINTFCMYNVSVKSIDRSLRPENQTSFKFEKRFFEQPKLDFGFFGVSFLKNRQKSLSSALQSLLRVVWSSKLYQTLSCTPINIFGVYNVFVKSIERNLRPKNQASFKFEFFLTAKICIRLGVVSDSLVTYTYVSFRNYNLCK